MLLSAGTGARLGPRMCVSGPSVRDMDPKWLLGSGVTFVKQERVECVLAGVRGEGESYSDVIGGRLDDCSVMLIHWVQMSTEGLPCGRNGNIRGQRCLISLEKMFSNIPGSDWF